MNLADLYKDNKPSTAKQTPTPNSSLTNYYSNPTGQLKSPTPLYVGNSGYGDSKLDKEGAVYVEELARLNDIRAERQGAADKWANGLVKGVGVAGTSIAENTLGLVYGLGASLISGGGFNKLYDNDFSRSLDGVNNYLQKEMPNYYSQKSQEYSLLKELGTANFWSDKFLNGAGYALGAYVTGAGLAKFASLGKLANAGRGLEGVKDLEGIAKAAKLTRVANATDYAKNAALMSFGESAQEARGIKDETKEKLIEDYKARYKKDPDSYAMQIIEDESDAAGNWGLASNLVITGISNALQFPKMLSPGYTANKIALNKITLEGGKYIPEIESVSKGITKSLVEGVLEEGGQESMQLLTQKTLSDYYSRGFKDKKDQHSLVESLTYGMKEAFGTKEGWESFLLGALLGGPTAVMQNNTAQKNQDTQQVANLRNVAISTNAAGKTLKSFENFVRSSSYEKDKDAALKSGSKFDYLNAEFDQNKAFVKNFIDKGDTEFLIQQYEDMKSMDDEEFKKIAGYKEGESLPKSKHEIIQDNINLVKELEKTHKDIQTIFPYDSSKFTPQEYQVAVTNLWHYGTSLKNLDKRKLELNNEFFKLASTLNIEEIDNPLVKAQAALINADLAKIDVLKKAYSEAYEKLANPATAKKTVKDIIKTADAEATISNEQGEPGITNPFSVEAIVKKLANGETLSEEEELFRTNNSEEVNKKLKVHQLTSEKARIQGEEKELNRLIEREKNAKSISQVIGIIKDKLKYVRTKLVNKEETIAYVEGLLSETTDLTLEQLQELTDILDNFAKKEKLNTNESKKKESITKFVKSEFQLLNDIQNRVKELKEQLALIKEYEQDYAKQIQYYESLLADPNLSTLSVKEIKDKISKVEKKLTLINKLIDGLRSIINNTLEYLKSITDIILQRSNKLDYWQKQKHFKVLDALKLKEYIDSNINRDVDIKLLEEYAANKKQFDALEADLLQALEAGDITEAAYNKEKERLVELTNKAVVLQRQLRYLNALITPINSAIKAEPASNITKPNVTTARVAEIDKQLAELAVVPEVISTIDENPETINQPYTDGDPNKTSIYTTEGGLDVDTEEELAIAQDKENKRAARKNRKPRIFILSPVPRRRLFRYTENNKITDQKLLVVTADNNSDLYKEITEEREKEDAEYIKWRKTVKEDNKGIYTVITDKNGAPIRVEGKLLFSTLTTEYRIDNEEIIVKNKEQAKKALNAFKAKLLSSNEQIFLPILSKSKGIAQLEAKIPGTQLRPSFNVLGRIADTLRNVPLFLSKVGIIGESTIAPKGKLYTRTPGGNYIDLIPRNINQEEINKIINLLAQAVNKELGEEVTQSVESATKEIEKLIFLGVKKEGADQFTLAVKKNNIIQIEDKEYKATDIFTQDGRLTPTGEQTLLPLLNRKKVHVNNAYDIDVDFEFEGPTLTTGEGVIYNSYKEFLLQGETPMFGTDLVTMDNVQFKNQYLNYENNVTVDEKLAPNPVPTTKDDKGNLVVTSTPVKQGSTTDTKADIERRRQELKTIKGTLRVDLGGFSIDNVSEKFYDNIIHATADSFYKDLKNWIDKFKKTQKPFTVIDSSEIIAKYDAELAALNNKGTTTRAKEEILNSIPDQNTEGLKRLKEKASSKRALTEREISWFKTKFPNIPIEVVKGLIDGEAFGKFLSAGKVLLSDEATNGTLYHEAFHAVTQLYLSKKQIDALYKEAGEKLGTTDRLTIEEHLAEDFFKYKETGKILGQRPQRNTIFRKILDFIRALFRLDAKSIEEVYNRLDKGYYTNKDIVGVREFSTLNKLAGKSVAYSKQVLDAIDAIFFERAFVNNLTPDEALDKSSALLASTHNEIKKRAKETDNLIALEAYTYILQNWKEVSTTWQKRAAAIGIEIDLNEDPNKDQDEEAKGRDTAYGEANQVSAKSTLSNASKLLIRSLKQKNANGEDKLSDLNLPQVVEFGNTYNFLLKELSGLSSYSDIYNKVVELSKTRPEFVDLKDRIGKEGTATSQEKFIFQQQFRQDFAKNQVNSHTTVIEADGKIYIIENNKQSRIDKIREGWKNASRGIAKQVTTGQLIIEPSEELLGLSNIKFLHAIGIDFSTETLPEVQDNQLITDTVEYIKAYIKEKNGDVTDLFSTKYGESPVSGRIDSLLELEAEFNPNVTELSYMSTEGKTIYSIGLNSMLSIIKNAINNTRANKEQIAAGLSDRDVLFARLPHLNTVGTEGSLWFSKLFSKDGFRREGINLELDLHDGLKTNNIKGGEFKQSTKGLSIGDKYVQEITSILMDGRSSYLRASDKSTEATFRLTKYAKGQKLAIPIADLAKGFDIQSVKEIFRGYFKSELKRIALFEIQGLGANIDVFGNTTDKDGKQVGNKGAKFTVFEGILDAKLKKSIYEQIQVLKIKSLTDKALEDKIKTMSQDKTLDAHGKLQLEETKKELERRKTGASVKSSETELGVEIDNLYKQVQSQVDADVIKYFDTYTTELLGKIKEFKVDTNGISRELYKETEGEVKEKQLEQLMRAVAVNDYINSIEQTKLFIGDMAFYKDLFKRTAGATGTKETSSTGENIDNWLNANNTRKDKKLANGKVNAVIYEDVVVASSYIKEYKAALMKVGYSPEEADILLKAYGSMDEGDAQGWITLDEYKEFALRRGVRDPKLYAAIDKAQKQIWKDGKLTNQETLLTKDEIASINILKAQYFGPQELNGLFAPAFHKYSLLPLVPQLVQGRNLEVMLNHMTDSNNQIGYALFKSGSKVGTPTNAEGKANSFYNENGEINTSNLQKQTIFYDFLGLQVKSSDVKDKVTFGTQFRKLLFSNAFGFGEEAVKGSNSKALLDEYNKIIDEIVETAKAKLIKNLGINPENLKIEDAAKLIALLRKEAEDRNLPDNIIDFLNTEIVDGLTVVENKLDASVNIAKINSMITSLVNTRLIKQKMNGDALIQVSSSGMESVGKRNIKEDKTKTYKFYTQNEDGTITYPAECAIPITGQYAFLLEQYGTLEDVNQAIRKGEIKKEILELVGYRIPTQGMNSIEYLTIKEFLPADSATAIILPSEIVAKSGGDFDVDKMNIFKPNLQFVDGKVVYVAKQSKEQIAELNALLKERAANKKLKKTDAALDKLLSAKLGTDINKISEEDVLDILEGKAKQNRIIEIAKQQISHPSNFAALITPNSTKILTDVVDELRYIKYVDRKKKEGKEYWDKEKYLKSTKDNLSNIRYSDQLKLTTKIDQFHKFLLAKDMIGIAAVANTHHILAQMVGMTINHFYTDKNGNLQPVTINLEHNKKDGKPNLSAIKDAEGKHNISEIISQIINATVDAAKDPFFFDLNMTMETLGTQLYLIRLGVPFETVAYFMNQPIVLQYLKETGKNKAGFLKGTFQGSDGQVAKRLLLDHLLKAGFKFKERKKADSKESTTIDTTNFVGIKNLGELKKRYRELAVINHPDKGGSTAKMQEINNEYSILSKNPYLLNSDREAAEVDAEGGDPIVLGDDTQSFDMMSKERLESYLHTENQTKDTGFYDVQIRVLTDFLQYKKQSQMLGDAARATNMDTAGLGKDIAVSERKMKEIEEVRKTGFVNGVDDILQKTMIKSFNQHEFAVKAFSPLYHIQDNPKAVTTRQELLDEINPSGPDNVNKISTLIDSDFINYVVQNYGYLGKEGNSIIEGVKKRLFTGENTPAKKLLDLKNKLNKSDKEQKLVDNMFIKELFPIIRNADRNQDNIKIYLKRYDTFTADQLTEAFREVGDMDLPLAKELYKEIMNVGILQSGLNNSPITYLGIIPQEYYAKIVKNAFKEFDKKGGAEDYKIFKELFLANNTNNAVIGRYTRANGIKGIGEGMFGKEYNKNLNQTSTSDNQGFSEENKFKPKGEKVADGIYVNQEGLSQEEELELFELVRPVLEQQAVRSNKGKSAPKMAGLQLNWDYVSNRRGNQTRVNVGESLRPNDTYGWFSSSANGQKLFPITGRMVELMSKATGIDVTDYDGSIINIYNENSFIGNHPDIDESKTAGKYPVVVVNIGGPGNIILGNKKVNLKSGAGYVFGVGGKNRTISHSTYASPIKGTLPSITTQMDGETLAAGSYRVSITVRRVMPLEKGMPSKPAIITAQTSASVKKTPSQEEQPYIVNEGESEDDETTESTQSSTSVKPTIDTSREWRGDLDSRPVYVKGEVGVNTMRTSDANAFENFGNPFSEAGYGGTIKVASISEAVRAYKDWLLGVDEPISNYMEYSISTTGKEMELRDTLLQDVKEKQRDWILDQINQGKLDGATLLYAGKSEARGQGMHPTALAEVVEQLRSKTTQPSNSVGREYTPENITTLKPNEVFVFGANTAGGHGGGTAGLAQRGTTSSNYTALPVGTKGKWSEYGVVDKLMQGTEGKSFGIVTKAATISGTSLKIGAKRSVPLSRIEESINALIKTASENPSLKFLVTKFGTNMAGFSEQEMKSLLENKNLPDNIILPKEFEVRTTTQSSGFKQDAALESKLKTFFNNFGFKFKEGDSSTDLLNKIIYTSSKDSSIFINNSVKAISQLLLANTNIDFHKLEGLIEGTPEFKKALSNSSDYLKTTHKFLKDGNRIPMEEWIPYNKDYNKIKNEVLEKYIKESLLDGKNFTELHKLINDFLKWFKNLFTDAKNLKEVTDSLIQQVLMNQKEVVINSKDLQNKERVTLAKALEETTHGKDIIKTLGEFGLILTGSVSAAEQGSVFRKVGKLLHDIDWVVPKGFTKDFNKKLKDTFSGATLVREFDSSTYYTQTYIVPPKGYTISNLTFFKPEIYGERKYIASYDVLDKNGNIVSNYRRYYDVKESGKIVENREVYNEGLKNVDKNLEAVSVDFFQNKEDLKYEAYTVNIEGVNLQLSNWLSSFTEKLKYGRAKDLLDYANFIPNDLVPSTSVKEGVEISSNAKGLAAALTNPTELAKSKGNLTQSYPVEFLGKIYKDSEAAYQALKGTATKDEGPNSTYNLMVNIIKAKLEQYPRLVEEITKQGGSAWILNSTHQPTKQNSVWETGGKNWFIKSLNEAYITITQPATPAVDTKVDKTITYTPIGKTQQTYTVKGSKIFNSKGVEVFAENSKDRNKIFANLAVQDKKAVVVEYKDKKYVVNKKGNILSVATGDIMKWTEENGNRKDIMQLANDKFESTPKNYKFQLDELMAEAQGLPADYQEKVAELIKNSKVTNDEELGDLKNKICNIGFSL